MGLLDKYKAGDVSVTGNGKYFPNEGRHRVLIKRCKVNDGFKGVTYIVECEAIDSDSDGLRAGDQVSQAMKLGTEYRYGEKDLKRFCCQLLKIDPTADDALELVRDRGAELLGREIKSSDPVTAFAEALEELSREDELDLPCVVQTWTRYTQNNKPVTHHRWEPEF